MGAIGGDDKRRLREGAAEAETDVAGRGLLESVPGGRWTIFGAAPGYRPAMLRLEVPDLSPSLSTFGLDGQGQTVILEFERGPNPNAASEWTRYR